jgi:hypothetical protein
MSNNVYTFLAALPNPIKVDAHDEKLVFAATGFFLEISREYADFADIKAHIETNWEMFSDKDWYKRYKRTGQISDDQS